MIVVKRFPILPVSDTRGFSAAQVLCSITRPVSKVLAERDAAWQGLCGTQSASARYYRAGKGPNFIALPQTRHRSNIAVFSVSRAASLSTGMWRCQTIVRHRIDGQVCHPCDLDIYSLVNVLSLPPKPGRSTSLSAETLRMGPFLLVSIYRYTRTPRLSVECVVGIARVLWYTGIADSAQYTTCTRNVEAFLKKRLILHTT